MKKTSNEFEQFKKFSKTAMPNVKALILPEGGQSFNPSAAEHSKTLKKIVTREAAEIEKELKSSLKHQI